MKRNLNLVRSVKISAYISPKDRKSWERASLRQKKSLSDLIRDGVNESIAREENGDR